MVSIGTVSRSAARPSGVTSTPPVLVFRIRPFWASPCTTRAALDSVNTAFKPSLVSSGVAPVAKTKREYDSTGDRGANSEVTMRFMTTP